MVRSTRRLIEKEVWKGERQKVIFGLLEPLPGHEPKVGNLFLCIGEKIPFECLMEVKKHVQQKKIGVDGVYMAHDSYGVPRYGGRGHIFRRLASRKKEYPKELVYFSFYIVKEKNHEKELENVILRAAGPQMTMNKVKVRTGTQPGSVRDYEPGTHFYVRIDSPNPAAKRGRTISKRVSRKLEE
ncbi:hypothetical protein [Methylocystis sp.]|uniref:hypothetical protein n=1 Tax=Methylocystis sp. TaxID=1911079 RepID=UPI0025ED4DEA|nr:hypothetical protein [Methylocystis sp.]